MQILQLVTSVIIYNFYLNKFILSELHLSEVTSYKIHILAKSFSPIY